VEAGVMKPLLHILNHSDKVGVVLKNVAETFSQCCQGKSTDFSATKASLNVLTRLIVDDDIDVLRHACWALFHLLDGLQNGDVRSVMQNPSFVKNILNHAIHLLQLSTFPIELPVLKTLHLITKADKAGGIDAIIRCEGIAAISKILSTDHEDHRILAYKVMCNIISGSSDRLQAAIDCEMFPQLFEILSQTQDKYALQVILEATGAANLVQSRYLVTSGCVKHLCTFLTTDIEALPCRLRQMRHCNTEIVALCSLRNVSYIFSLIWYDFLWSDISVSFMTGSSYSLLRNPWWVIVLAGVTGGIKTPKMNQMRTLALTKMKISVR